MTSHFLDTTKHKRKEEGGRKEKRKKGKERKGEGKNNG